MKSRQPRQKAGSTRLSQAARHAALGWWLADIAGAALFAFGLATTVAGWSGPAPTRLMGIAAIAAAGCLRAFAQGMAADVGMAAAHRSKAALRQTLLPRLFATAFSRGRMAGEDTARAVDTIEATEGFTARYLPLRQAAAVGPLIVAGLVALASPIAAAILLATLIPFVIGMVLAGTAAGAAADKQLGAIGQLNGLFLDRLRALPEIRSFGAEGRIARQLAAASDEVSQRTLALFRIAFISGGVLEFFASLSLALVAVYCGFNLLGTLPIDVPEKLGLFAAFFALAMAPDFYLPMRRLAAAYHDKQTGEAAQTALAEDLPQAPPQPPPAAFAGLHINAACIHYARGPSLGPFTLHLPATGLFALVGPSGCGKSSLLAAVAGLTPLSEGALVWQAGAPAPAAWAGQRPLVLAGTLAQNIALGRPDAPHADIEAAAHAAGLARLLAARTLEGPLDAEGSGLSGGERRRLGLARALASARPLLLLDEPTADLDRETADAIIATIAALAQTRAILVATHDARLAAAAHHQLVMP
jgi:ATP-binding cassette subfamily C protein CydD